MGKMIDRMIWRLLTENVVREKKNNNGKGNHCQLNPDDSDAKKIITTKCNDSSLVTRHLLF